ARVIRDDGFPRRSEELRVPSGAGLRGVDYAGGDRRQADLRAGRAGARPGPFGDWSGNDSAGRSRADFCGDGRHADAGGKADSLADHFFLAGADDYADHLHYTAAPESRFRAQTILGLIAACLTCKTSRRLWRW